jgi:hypothetical protein
MSKSSSHLLAESATYQAAFAGSGDRGAGGMIEQQGVFHRNHDGRRRYRMPLRQRIQVHA